MADHIPFVDLDTDDEITQLLFEGTTQMLGRVPNSTRIAAHSPFVQLMFLPFGAVSQREGAGGVLTSKLKEMVIIKTSKTNGCDYWLAHNTALGRAAGITEEQVQVIGSDDYMESDLLNDREKAAVLWAEHVTKNTAKSRDDVYELVRNTFDNTELVELTIICGQFNFRNRYMDSLRIPVEPPKEVDKIKTSVNLDPETVRNYLQLVLDKWPKEFPKVHPDE